MWWGGLWAEEATWHFSTLSVAMTLDFFPHDRGPIPVMGGSVLGSKIREGKNHYSHRDGIKAHHRLVMGALAQEAGLL